MRELGALESVGVRAVANVPYIDPIKGDLAVRAEGPVIDETAVEHARAIFADVDDDDGAGGRGAAAKPPASIIQRLQQWLRRLLASCQRADGPQYVPGRRAFER